MSQSPGDVAAAAERKPIQIPAAPHMPAEAVAFLAERFRTTTCFLEYGAGGSTRMAVRSNVPFVFSVESDTAFAEEVHRMVSQEARATRFTISAGGIGPTGKWGRPVDTLACGKWPRYVVAIWEKIAQAGQSPDLILIDGRFRVACFLFSLIKSAPGAILMFDDYVGREARYQSVETVVKPARFLDRTAVFERPAEFDMARAVTELVLHVTDPR